MANKKRTDRPLLSPRWSKVLRDMWIYKGRSFLVVLTIAVGVAGVGVVGQAIAILSRAMSDSQISAQPAQITLFTAPFNDEDILDQLHELPEVSRAEAFSFYRLRINVSGDGSGQPAANMWKNFELFAIPDFTNKQVDRITPEHIESEWPPSEGTLLLERLAAQYLEVKVNDSVWIETPDSELHRFNVDGTVRSPGRESATLSRVGSGFISMGTLETIGLPSGFNTIVIRVHGDGKDEKLLESIATSARELLREQSVEVISTWIPEAGKHWASDIVISMGSILQSLGGLALVAAAFLVVNTMLAILSSQLRQIGVMQVLGADRRSLVRMYLTQALIFGVLALPIGLPIGFMGAGALTGQSNTLLNFKSDGYGLSYYVLTLQIAIGIGLPLLAAYMPVIRGTSISVREAIGGVPSSKQGRRSPIDRIVESIRGLPRPFLLSIRNTFRQKGRLLLTLATLGLGGAIVVSVFSVHASLMNTLDQSLRYADYDVRITTAEPQDEEWLTEIALKVPGMVKTEQWGFIHAHRVLADGSESAELTVEALPADSGFIHPHMIQGEWLSPGEDNALVFDSYLLRKHPDLRVGDQIVLNIEDKKTAWYIKGFARKTVGKPVSYITKEGLQRATDDDSRASLIHITIGQHDSVSQSAVESEMKTLLKDEGIGVSSTELATEMRSVQAARMNIVVAFLSMMAILLSIVSALGLAGTMSLNVLERTREFGILRSIGGRDGSIAWIVIAEGAFLGTLGWGTGCIIAVPVTSWLCQSVGISLYQAPLDMVYSWTGVGFWFVTAIVLSALASLTPAWNATRLSIREVLAYE